MHATVLPFPGSDLRSSAAGARYLPGPRWWGRRLGVDGRRISGITQPPLAATCMRVLSEVDGVRRRDTGSVDAAERPSDEHYRRFVTLVRQGTASGWDQRELARSSGFRVLDAGFSAILARACLDLAFVAEELGEHRIAEESRAAGERVSAALRARAGSDGLIRAVDTVDGSPLDVTSAGSGLALLAPGLGDKHIAAGRAELLHGRLSSRYGVRSLDATHPGRTARKYWRGPVWANVSWLSARGLELHGEERAARTLRAQMMVTVEGGGMREYFVPGSGRGLGAHDFAWTAALCLHELSRDAGARRLAA